MEFIKEALLALVLVGVPIGLFTLAIVWWGLRNGHFLNTKDSKELGRELKSLSKQKVKAEDDNRDLIHKNWARFGGGFYGIVAFFTYIVVEITEITTMIINIGGLWDFIRQLDLDVIINILIEALTNFITAITWPLYWMRQIDTGQAWIWFVAAYIGYLQGIKLAQRLVERRSQD